MYISFQMFYIMIYNYLTGFCFVNIVILLTKGRYVKTVLAVAPVVGTAEAPEDRLDDRLQDYVQHDYQDNAQQIIHIVHFWLVYIDHSLAVALSQLHSPVCAATLPAVIAGYQHRGMLDHEAVSLQVASRVVLFA